jgi:hypothetical protein
VPENNLGVFRHVYQDNFYHGVKMLGHLLQQRIGVNGAAQPNTDIPKNLEKTAKELKRRRSYFRRKSDVIVWKDKRPLRIVRRPTVHNSEHVNTGRSIETQNTDINKPKCIAKYNRYMKGVDSADQYLSYYSIVIRTVKCFKKLSLFLLNWATCGFSLPQILQLCLHTKPPT